MDRGIICVYDKHELVSKMQKTQKKQQLHDVLCFTMHFKNPSDPCHWAATWRSGLQQASAAFDVRGVCWSAHVHGWPSTPKKIIEHHFILNIVASVVPFARFFCTCAGQRGFGFWQILLWKVCCIIALSIRGAVALA